MGTGLPALNRAPGPIQGPYGCLIEHTALLIELTALSVGPFPPSIEEGDYSTPVWDPCTVPQRTEQGGREAGGGVGGWRKQRVR